MVANTDVPLQAAGDDDEIGWTDAEQLVGNGRSR